MSDFWDDIEDDDDDGSFEMPGGSFDPIPNNTAVLAFIDEAKWDSDYNKNEYLSLRWSVLAPDAYKNRKIFQKLWLTDDDPRANDPEKKRKNAKAMFKAININTGKGLSAANGMPGNEDLQRALENKPMDIRSMLWEIKDDKTGDMIRGNWVSSVGPKGSLGVTDAAAAAPPPSYNRNRPKGSSRPPVSDPLDDDIPF